jgi:hypothetical protein
MTFEQYTALATSKINVTTLRAKILGYERSVKTWGAEPIKSRCINKIVPIIEIKRDIGAILVSLKENKASEYHFHYSEIEIIGSPAPISFHPVGLSKIEYNLDSYKKFFEVN